jgi:hypothetical protein
MKQIQSSVLEILEFVSEFIEMYTYHYKPYSKWFNIKDMTEELDDQIKETVGFRRDLAEFVSPFRTNANVSVDDETLAIRIYKKYTDPELIWDSICKKAQ